jgi:hypothetical protein
MADSFNQRRAIPRRFLEEKKSEESETFENNHGYACGIAGGHGHSIVCH